MLGTFLESMYLFILPSIDRAVWQLAKIDKFGIIWDKRQQE